ncbi:DUF1127 domain-containing protein [Falsirhodobacter deserti]|uniref:DUF1127 domain-containing protein n=1 Tax=Falsirhodobacter deserti TaxID=1365611 RepID=UPI000FE33249|nr:DUF1127 domain-containing protein [Falsirhodobacter deserti]
MSLPNNLQAALPLPPFARAAFGIANTILNWELRRITRRRLALLDDYQLADIGLTAEDAAMEAEKPFWRP